MQLGSKKSAALDSAPICLRVNDNAVYVLTQSRIYQLSLSDLSTVNYTDYLSGLSYSYMPPGARDMQLGQSGKIYFHLSFSRGTSRYMYIQIYDADLSLLDTYEHSYFYAFSRGVAPSSDEQYVYVPFDNNAPKKLRISDWAVMATGDSSDAQVYAPNVIWADSDYVYDVYHAAATAHNKLKKLSASDLSHITTSVSSGNNTTRSWSWNGKDYFYIALGLTKPGYTWMFRKSDLTVTFKSWQTGGPYFGAFKSLVEYEDMNPEDAYVFAVRYDSPELWKIKIEAGEMTSKEDYLTVTGILKPMTVRGLEAWITTSEASYYVRNVNELGMAVPSGGGSMASKLMAAGLL